MLLVQFRNRPHVHRVVNMPAVAGGGFGVAIKQAVRNLATVFRAVAIPSTAPVWVQGRQPVGDISFAREWPHRLGVGRYVAASPESLWAETLAEADPSPGWLTPVLAVARGKFGLLGAVTHWTEVGTSVFIDGEQRATAGWVYTPETFKHFLWATTGGDLLVRVVSPDLWWVLRVSKDRRLAALYRVDRGHEVVSEFAMPMYETVSDFDVTPDGRRVLMAVKTRDSVPLWRYGNNDDERSVSAFALWEFHIGDKHPSRQFTVPARRLAIAPDGATVAFSWMQRRKKRLNDPNPVWRTRGLGILDLE